MSPSEAATTIFDQFLTRRKLMQLSEGRQKLLIQYSAREQVVSRLVMTGGKRCAARGLSPTDVSAIGSEIPDARVISCRWGLGGSFC